jgi:rod shape-determining protein MreC
LGQQKEWLWRAFFVLVLLLSVYWFSPASRVTHRMGSFFLHPLLRPYVFVQSLFHDFSGWIVSRKQLLAQLDELKNEQVQLISEVIELQALYDYKSDIEDMLVFKKRYKRFQAGVARQVLFIHQGTDEQFILIDGGSVDGVSKDMLLLVENNLVGRIEEVFPYYSKALLVSDARLKIAGYCAKSRARGIVEGSNQYKMKLKFIAHTKRLRKDDLVMTCGEGILYPRGLCLGKVFEFVKGPVEYDVTVVPLCDYSKLSYCLVVDSIGKK